MSGVGSSSSRDADKALRSTPGKANFQRVTRLLISGGTMLLRDKFDSIYPPSNLPLKLKDPAVEKVLKAAKLTKPQWDCLYPSPGVYGKSTEFDITLLSRLLRTICILSPPPTGWDNLPNSTDHSLTADLVRVKFFRNSVYGHVNENMEIPDEDFPCLWKEISEVLVRIAGNISTDKKNEWQKAIKNFSKDPLTPEDERNVDELKRWYASDMDVKKSIEELKSASARLEKGMSQLVGNTQRSSSSGSQSEGVQLHLHIDFETTSEKQGMLQKLAMRCLTVDPSKPEELNGFIQYLENVRKLLLVDVQPHGSVLLTVECRTLQILEGLWEDYCTGHLEEMAQSLLVTPDILKEVDLLPVKIKITIEEEEYMACKEHFPLKSGNQTPLGLTYGRIVDSQITESSQTDVNQSPSEKQPHLQRCEDKVGSWPARVEWLQVDLNSVIEVKGIETQGGGDCEQWVTSYKLQYSADGIKFQYYTQCGVEILEGNKDSNTTMYHDLNPPIKARYVRVCPVTWFGHISMRVELYGPGNKWGWKELAAGGAAGAAAVVVAPLALGAVGFTSAGVAVGSIAAVAQSAGSVIAGSAVLESAGIFFIAGVSGGAGTLLTRWWRGRQKPLGMASGDITGNQITTSSQLDKNHAPSKGRLNLQKREDKAGCWSAGIQIDLNNATEIKGIATRGGGDGKQWVTKYKLQYSVDGTEFLYYKQDNTDKILEGNSDSDTIVNHDLNPPIKAHYIRVCPLDWFGHISMRVELFGVPVVPDQ